MKLIATTIAASILSFNVMAADSSHCNSLDKGPQFNKTVLSEFDKCWLNTHKADEKSGVDGNVFWMKVNGKFISIPLKDLVNEGSKEKAKKLVVNTVVDTLVTDALEAEITNLNETISNLEADRDRLFAALGNSEDLAAALDAINVISGEITRLRVAVDQYAIEVADAYAQRDGFQNQRDALQSRLNAIDDARTLAIGTISTRAAFSNDILNIIGQNAGGHYNKVAETTAAQTASFANTNISNVVESRTGGFHNPATVSYSIDINGLTFETSSWTTRIQAMTDAIEQAYDEGYSQGFSDGYEAGYADGYRDGYAAGVNSH